jgi:hypothetical protein
MARMDPVDDARALVAERFPDAVAAFIGDGVLSSRRTATSDLDIVVVLGTALHVRSCRSVGAWRARYGSQRTVIVAGAATAVPGVRGIPVGAT